MRLPAQLADVVARVWRDHLGLAEVDPADDFFELGGHSLSAIQVTSAIAGELGLEIPLYALFEDTTLDRFQRRVEAARDSEPRETGPAERRPTYSASSGQRRMWLLDQLEPDSPEYVRALTLFISGSLDEAALVDALGDVVHRHDALRTRYHFDGGDLLAVVEPAEPFDVVEVDLRYTDDPCARLDTLARVDAARPFDLRHGPMLRASLARLADAEWALLLAMHHVAADRWSEGVITADLAEMYAARTDARPPRPREPDRQYGDYAAWQRCLLQRTDMRTHLAYWERQLAGLGARRPPPTQRGSAATYGFSIDTDLAARLEDLGRSVGATPFMALLAGFQALLCEHSGQTDIAVGTPVAGRTRPEFDQVVGFFVNTLVMRVDVGGDPSYVELLGRVRRIALAAYTHQDAPFDAVVEQVRPQRDLGRTPLFQVWFVVYDEGSVGLPGLRVSRRGLNSETARLDLSLQLERLSDGSFSGVIEYSTDVFDAPAAGRLGQRLVRLLDAVTARPSTRLSELARAEYV